MPSTEQTLPESRSDPAAVRVRVRLAPVSLSALIEVVLLPTALDHVSAEVLNGKFYFRH